MDDNIMFHLTTRINMLEMLVLDHIAKSGRTSSTEQNNANVGSSAPNGQTPKSVRRPLDMSFINGEAGQTVNVAGVSKGLTPENVIAPPKAQPEELEMTMLHIDPPAPGTDKPVVTTEIIREEKPAGPPAVPPENPALRREYLKSVLRKAGNGNEFTAGTRTSTLEAMVAALDAPAADPTKTTSPAKEKALKIIKDTEEKKAAKQAAAQQDAPPPPPPPPAAPPAGKTWDEMTIRERARAVCVDLTKAKGQEFAVATMKRASGFEKLSDVQDDVTLNKIIETCQAEIRAHALLAKMKE